MRLLTLLMFCIWITQSGCATPPSQAQVSQLDYGPPPENHEATIKKFFDGVLFDPYSVRYEFEPPEQYWVKDPPLRGGGLTSGWFVRVGVNAKNRFGAYVGRKMYGFIIKDERIVKVIEEADLKNMRTR